MLGMPIWLGLIVVLVAQATARYLQRDRSEPAPPSPEFAAELQASQERHTREMLEGTSRFRGAKPGEYLTHGELDGSPY